MIFFDFLNCLLCQNKLQQKFAAQYISCKQVLTSSHRSEFLINRGKKLTSIYRNKRKVWLAFLRRAISTIIIMPGQTTSPKYISQKQGRFQEIQYQNNQHQSQTPLKLQTLQIQSKLEFLRTPNEISIKIIEEVNDCLKLRSIWDFLQIWQTGFKQSIKQIIKNWLFYQDQFLQQLVIFTKLVSFKLIKLKLKKIRVYDQIFADVSKITSQLVNMLGTENAVNLCQSEKQQSTQQLQKQEAKHIKETQILKEIQETYQIQNQTAIQQIIDQYILHKSTINRDLPLNLKIGSKKINASQFIASELANHKDSTQLRKIITVINHYLTQKSIKSPQKHPYKQCHSQDKEKQNYFTTIEQERVVETRCLGCSTFFKANTNILDQTTNYTPFKIFPSVGQMKNYQSQIKDQICFMLNSGGGIILFDCFQLYEKIIPKGIFLNQKNKESYQQIITSYLDAFYPKKDLKRSLDIKFVPVVADQFKISNNQIMLQNYLGEESQLKRNQRYRIRPYLQSVYVTRIRIRPISGQKVYFWNQNNEKEEKKEINQSYLCTAAKQGAKTMIRMSKIQHLIKQKMKKYYLPENYPFYKRLYLENPYSYFDHNCRDPQVGVGHCIQLNGHYDQLESGKELKKQKSLALQYRNMTLIIIKKQNINEARSAFISGGFQCKIQFLQFKTLILQHAALIYYNKRFEELFHLINKNPAFSFSGKQLIVINITSYVRLSDRNEKIVFSASQFDNLKSLLAREYPQEEVKLFQFRPNPQKKEYYLQGQTQMSNLFIYFALNQHKVKAALKNPLHLDKMSYEQKSRQFKQIYSRQQSSHYQSQEVQLNNLLSKRCVSQRNSEQ